MAIVGPRRNPVETLRIGMVIINISLLQARHIHIKCKTICSKKYIIMYLWSLSRRLHRPCHEQTIKVNKYMEELAVKKLIFQ